MVKIIKPKMKKGSIIKWRGPKKTKVNRAKEAQRIKRYRLRAECILPAGYVAQYFFKQAPSTNGLIIDESENGNDAQLVQSNCLMGDGNTLAVGNTETIHNGSFMDFEFFFKVNSIAPSEVNTLFSKGTGSNTEFTARIAGDDIQFYFGNGTSIESIIVYNMVTAGDWHHIKGSFDSGFVTLIFNGVEYNTTLSFNTLLDSGQVSQVMIYGGVYLLKGALAKCQVGFADYNCAEGGKSTQLFNTGTAGGTATITGFSMPTLWGKQNRYHHNIKGFDLWTNGVIGEEIRVPIGSTVIEAGYTFVSTNPGGAWHNNAESALQLPATLKTVTDGDIVNPPFYADWKALYGTPPNYSALSNIEENKHKFMVFYNKFLTNTEIEKALKCIKETQHLWKDAETWNDAETWID